MRKGGRNHQTEFVFIPRKNGCEQASFRYAMVVGVGAGYTPVHMSQGHGQYRFGRIHTNFLGVFKFT